MARLVRWQITLAVLGVMVIGGLLAQLSFTSQKVVEPVRGGVYTEGLVGTPQYLNPLLASSYADQAIVSLIFEGLSTLKPDGSIVPALAESWEGSPDGTIYTCTLRAGARWQDGEPVTVDDVLFTLDLVRSPAIEDPNELANLWSQVQAEALDSQRLRFTLERPYAPFLSYTTLPILPAHLLQDVAPSSLRLSPFNLSPIGTGPFRFSGIEEGEGGVLSLDLEANPFYYGPTPYLEQLRFRFYRDEGSAVQALLRGEIDGTLVDSSEQLKLLEGQPDLAFSSTYLQAYTILFLNAGSPLLSDIRLRQAIAASLNQDSLIESLDEQVFPANGPISPISWAYKPDLPHVQYDPTNAANILAQAGWHDQNGDGILERDLRSLELTLLTNDMPADRVKLARRIEQQLAPLGIAVRVVVRNDPAAYDQDVENRNYDLLLGGLRQLGRDPDEFALWHSSQVGPGGRNYSSFQDETVDKLLEKGRTVEDRDQRTAVYWQFQELFVQQVPAIPLYYPIYTYVQNSRIHGLVLAPLNDLGDRFRSVADWYVRTEKRIEGRSAPAPRYENGH